MTAPRLTSIDPLDSAHLADPYPAWAEAQASEGVTYVAALDAWAVTRHDLVLAVVRDHATYTSTPPASVVERTAELRGEIPGACPVDYPSLANTDPPTHTRIRKVSQRLLTQTVATREPQFRAIAAGLIDGFAPDGTADVIARFAVPLPIAVLCSLMGIDPLKWRRIKLWSDNSVRVHAPGLSASQRRALARTSAGLHAFLSDLVEARRAEPGDDLVSGLVGELSTEEVIGVLAQTVIAGHETLSALIGRMMLLLAERPELQTRLRADVSLVPPVVEECLRHRSPVKGVMRSTTREVELGGQHLPAGARVAVLFGAANRDPRRFEHPDLFDSNREDITGHIAFGKGVHFCLGAALARLETRIAIDEVITRLPGLRLAGDCPPIEMLSFMINGLSALHLEWDAH